jgi:hypothetical protein
MTLQRFQRQRLPKEYGSDILVYLGTSGQATLAKDTGRITLNVCPQCGQKNIPYTADSSVCSFCNFAALPSQDIEEQKGCF